MKSRGSSNARNLEALLELGRSVPRQPDAVRQRVLARATLAAALEPPSLPRTAPIRPTHSFYVPLSAGVALALGLAGTVYALGGRWPRPDPVSQRAPVVATATATKTGDARPSRAQASSEAPAPAVPVAAPPLAGGEPAAGRAPRRAPQGVPSSQTYDAELGLMRSAHNAYAAHEFANALVLVSEHARRFPHGLLAEEREALRVRCLLAAGRTSEAQRAAADFPRRFPRSVLVPRIQAEVQQRPP